MEQRGVDFRRRTSHNTLNCHPRAARVPCRLGFAWHKPALQALVPAAHATRLLRSDGDGSRAPTTGPSRAPSTDPQLVKPVGDGQPDLGAHGPKLLPRPQRKQQPKPSGPPPPSPGERTLASLAVYVGLVGTTAILMANAAGIDLWGSFRWSDTDDLLLALQLSLPLQAVNALLLLPSYSSWKLPTLTDLVTVEDKLRSEQQARLQTHLKEQQQQQQQSDAASAPTCTSASASSPVPAASDRADADQQPSTSHASLAPAPAASPAGPGPGSSSGPPPGAIPASAWGWGRSGGGPGGKGDGGDSGAWRLGGTDLTGLKDALHLAQGYYISNNPTARLTPLAEGVVAVVDCAAGEMLYRGVALVWLAAWMEDRVYEAGLDELLTVDVPRLAAQLGGPQAVSAVEALGTQGMCEVAVAGGVVAFVVWSVMRRAKRATSRLTMLLSQFQRATGGSSSSSSGASKGAGQKGSLNDLLRTLKPSEPSSSSSSSPSSSTSTPTSSSSSSSSSSKLDGQQGQGQGSGQQAKAPGRAADEAARVSLQLGSMGGQPVGAVAVMENAAAIQAVRDAAQVALLNGIFIATGGNLAASFAAAAANQLLLSAMQRRGLARMKERSAAMARELKAYNVELAKIANKYKDRLPKEYAQSPALREALDGPAAAPPTAPLAANTQPQPTPTAGPNAAAPAQAEQPATASSPPAPSSATGSNHGSAASTNSAATATDNGNLDRLASAAHAVPAAAEHGASAGPQGAKAVEDNPMSGSGMARALSILDQLLPDPPKPERPSKAVGATAAAKAGSSGSGAGSEDGSSGGKA